MTSKELATGGVITIKDIMNQNEELILENKRLTKENQELKEELELEKFENFIVFREENAKLKKFIEENQEKIEASDKLLVIFGKLLMAIRIMNYREVDVALLKECDTANEYNEFGSIELQEEDFKFLKEVLKEYGKF